MNALPQRWTATGARRKVLRFDRLQSVIDCICQCGTRRTIRWGDFIKGKSSSCGCIQKDKTPLRKWKTPTHIIWICMKQRCTNPKNVGWKHYGGRGIRVCDRWQTFANFLADMGERPSLKHSIDRINNDSDYEPGNCRWATDVEQAANNRRTKITEDQAVEIVRAMRNRKRGLTTALALKYGVCPDTISMIANGKSHASAFARAHPST